MNKIERALNTAFGDEISWIGKKVRANAWKSILCAWGVGFFCGLVVSTL